jgi:response regulator RpfG family c-di-GMP phosphodiesterase
MISNTGHELYDEMKKIDSKLKICFMTATYMNHEELRNAFPTIETECYIQKPVSINDLIRRITSKLNNDNNSTGKINRVSYNHNKPYC